MYFILYICVSIPLPSHTFQPYHFGDLQFQMELRPISRIKPIISQTSLFRSECEEYVLVHNLRFQYITKLVNAGDGILYYISPGGTENCLSQGRVEKLTQKDFFCSSLQLTCFVRDNSSIPHGGSDSLLLHRDLIALEQYGL